MGNAIGVTVKNYLSLVKFSHTIFAMPFALIGFALGAKQLNFSIDWSLAWKVVLCMIFARTAAMAFNRWADRKYDALNPRTVVREIPSGTIPAKYALAFTIMNCLAFVITCRFINPSCFYLSFVALAVVLGYSYTKRFTALCHFVLGLGLSLAPIGAYLAVTGKFALVPVLFSFLVLFWVSGFDIIYALQDEAFDSENNLKSIPALLGTKGALNLSNVLHILCAVLVFSIGYQADFGWIYFIGATLFSGLLFYQHTLVKHNDLSKINLAFFTTNGIASVVFSVFVLAAILA